jgi:hypothetical protein
MYLHLLFLYLIHLFIVLVFRYLFRHLIIISNSHHVLLIIILLKSFILWPVIVHCLIDRGLKCFILIIFWFLHQKFFIINFVIIADLIKDHYFFKVGFAYLHLIDNLFDLFIHNQRILIIIIELTINFLSKGCHFLIASLYSY